MKRFLSLLLAIVMVLSLLPLSAFAAQEASVTSYLAFTADVHNSSNNQAANRLNMWINNVTAKIGRNIDVMSFCGDFASAMANENDYWTFTQRVMSTVNNSGHVYDAVFIPGNHEYMPGRFGYSTNEAAMHIQRIGEARNTSDYILYAFGTHDWDNYMDQYDMSDINTLDSYLGNLSSADREKPIFILSHFPAHAFRFRSTSNAGQLIDVLNKYGDQGYDIYFIWGHNHTVGDTHYDEVITGSLDGTPISFTYLAAGCMSDTEYVAGSASVKGKGLLVGIKDQKVVSMQYFDQYGNDVTEFHAVQLPFSAERDGWCIMNSKSAFGYPNGYVIPVSSYGIFQKSPISVGAYLALVESLRQIFKIYTGSCFGMSLLAAAEYEGVIDLHSMFPSHTEPGLANYGYQQISADENDAGKQYFSVAGNQQVISAIEKAHISQISNEFMDTEVWKGNASYASLLNYLRSGADDPILVTLEGKNLWRHAVLIEPAAPQSLADEDGWGAGWYRLALCDPNTPASGEKLETPKRYYGYSSSLMVNESTGEWKYVLENGNGEQLDVRSNAYSNWLGHGYIRFYDVTKLTEDYFTQGLTMSFARNIIFNASAIEISGDAGAVMSFENGEMTSCADGYDYQAVFGDENAGSDVRLVGVPDESLSYATDEDAEVTMIDTENHYSLSTSGACSASVDSANRTIEIKSDQDVKFEVTTERTVSEGEGAVSLSATSGGDVSLSITDSEIEIQGADIQDLSVSVDGSESTNTQEISVEDGVITVRLDPETAETTGVCGDGLSWSLRDGTLVIRGDGEMADYGDGVRSPWAALEKNVQQVILAEGVTRIGANAFSGCSSLSSAAISSSVTTIAAGAFGGCGNLAELRYPGSQEQWAAIQIGADNEPLQCAQLLPMELQMVSQPRSVTASLAVGGTVAFTADAIGSMLRFQWQSRQSGETEWTDSALDGAQTTTLVVPVTEAYSGSSFRCRIKDAQGNELLSDAAVLTIVRPNPFTDVPEGKYYTDPVLWAFYHDPQITTGVTDDTFVPDRTCTRAQVVTFLWRASGCPEPTSTVNSFKDVPNGKYYTKAVLWASEQGITTGYADGTFRPNAECTRAQVVTFLWRAAGSPDPTNTSNPFRDVSASAYCFKAVLWALENGITTGKTPTTFNPDGVCTRAHVVTFLYRSMT